MLFGFNINQNQQFHFHIYFQGLEKICLNGKPNDLDPSLQKKKKKKVHNEFLHYKYEPTYKY